MRALACCLLLAARLARADDGAPQSVDVHDVPVYPLVTRLAEHWKLNVFVQGDPLQRISLKGEYGSAEQLLRELSRATGLERLQLLGAEVLVPKGCTPAMPAEPPRMPDEPITTSIAWANPLAVARIAAEMGHYEAGPATAEAPRSVIAIRTENFSIRSIYQVVAAIAGIEMLPGKGRTARLAEQPDPACDVLQPAPAEIRRLGMPPPRTEDASCPRRTLERQYGKPGMGPCRPLELQALETLRFRGRITSAAGPDQALVESPDGRIHGVTTDSLIGPDLGLVKSVEDTGVVVEDVPPDAAGRRSRRVVRLGYEGLQVLPR